MIQKRRLSSLRAAAFKAFCQRLSQPAFASLLPLLLPWVEGLAQAQDFDLEDLASAADEQAWLWQYEAAQFLGAHAQGQAQARALESLLRLGTGPNDLVAEGAAKGLAQVSLAQGPEGHELVASWLEAQDPKQRVVGSHALALLIKALWPRAKERLLQLLAQAAADSDGRVRRGMGQHLLGSLLFEADAAAALELTRAWLRDPNALLRQAALASLRAPLGHSLRAPGRAEIEPLLGDADTAVANDAKKFLKDLDDPA